MDIFSLILPKYIIDKNKKIRLISLFSGYDSQKLAFDYLGIDVEHYCAIEFDKYAIQSLNEIHNTYFETKDITKVNADELGIVDTENITYLLTYSFPCTDLSIAGKRAGMDKESGTRSGLLWEVERLLRETKEKPQILIMENVPQVLSAKGWREWNVFLENLGYSNYAQILNAKNFGIPQNRERCFMVSILGDYSYEFPRPFELKDRLKDFLETNVDEKYYLSEKTIERISKWKAQQDPLKDIDKEKSISPCLTARGAGEEHSGMILINENLYKNENRKNIIDIGVVIKEQYQGTYNYDSSDNFISGKSRYKYNNNIMPTLLTRDKVGVVVKVENYSPDEHNVNTIVDNIPSLRIRKLTPLECFKLMGVKPSDYLKISCSNAQKYKQAGNSIVTTCLMAIYSQLFDDVDYKYYIEKLLKELRTNGNNISSL